MEKWYIEVLSRALEKRRSKNKRYSLRAYAKYLGIDHGVLSLILAGKRLPSKSLCKILPPKLALSATESEAFDRSVEEARRQRSLRRANRKFDARHTGAYEIQIPVTNEQYGEIAEWYYSSILELPFIEGFQSKPEWISKSLGITIDQAKTAMDKLVQFGLFKWDGDRLVRVSGLLVTTDRNKTAPLLQNRQAQLLRKSIEAIYSVPIEQRNHSSFTMAIDPSRISEAKRMIEEFSRSLFQFLKGGKPSQVYELSVQLFPTQLKEIR